MANEPSHVAQSQCCATQCDTMSKMSRGSVTRTLGGSGSGIGAFLGTLFTGDALRASGVAVRVVRRVWNEGFPSTKKVQFSNKANQPTSQPTN